MDTWHGPYLKGGTVPLDPWRNQYVYVAPGAHGPYDLISYGSDGREGRRRIGSRYHQLAALTHEPER